MKARIPTLLILIVSMVLGMLVTLLVGPLPPNARIQHLLVLLLVLLLLATFTQRMLPKPRPRRRTITVIKCLSCDMRLERDFREGDYVFKRVGKCRCGGELYIDMIYDIES